jgi:hypothetical protein
MRCDAPVSLPDSVTLRPAVRGKQSGSKLQPLTCHEHLLHCMAQGPYQKLGSFPKGQGRGNLGAEVGTLMRCRVPEGNSGEHNGNLAPGVAPGRRLMGKPRGPPRTAQPAAGATKGPAAAAGQLYGNLRAAPWGATLDVGKPAGNNLDRDICGAGVG